MDLDMDMDVDVDFVPDEPIAPELAAEETAVSNSLCIVLTIWKLSRSVANLSGSGKGDRSDGEIAEESDTLAPTKVHVKGLDILKPDDIKAYVAEHFPESPFERVEWIDDSSANLIFESEPLAARALEALAAEPIQDVAQLPLQVFLAAKPYSQMPDVHLKVRLAVVSDKKEAGAAQRSRFYLLNPEYDPEERRRRNETRRYRERDGGGYSRRRGRYPPRDDEPTEQFDVSLYDDDEASRANRAPVSRPRRRRSYTSDSERSEHRRDSYRGADYRDDYRSENRGKELFPLGSESSSRRESRRDRSASPARDGDRNMDLDDLSNTNNNNANDGASTAANRDRARAIRSHKSRSNRSRELFPEKLKSGSGRLGDGGVEDAADLIAKGIVLPLMDGSSDVSSSVTTTTTTTTRAPPRRLEDRITVPGQGGGRLADRISSPGRAAAASGGGSGPSSSFNIRGAANQKGADQGFAIKGVAGKSVKELFPDKFSGNSGKELFADRLEGRTRQRQRAGDLFD